MSIYRGYTIIKDKHSFYIDCGFYNLSFKTEEEAMNKIDSIERKRVARDQANTQRIDNQVKR